MSHYWRLLRENPEFAKLWIAQVISLTGDWFNTVVLLGLVAEYSNGSGVAISIYLILRSVPPLLVSPFAGVLLDRFNRRNLLIWSNVLRALVVPIFLLANSPDMLWLIYVVTVVQFVLSAIFEPGQAAIIPALVKPDDIVEGNTLMSVTWSVMLALGAIVGGVFAFVFGSTAALLADAATFAVAGFILTRVRYDPELGRKLAKAVGVDPTKEGDTSFIEGVRYVLRTPQVAAGLFVKFGQSIGNIDTMLTIFATQLFVIGARGELSLALLWSAFGVGAIVGPLLTNRFKNGTVSRLRRLVTVGFLLLVISWPVMGSITEQFPVAIGLLIVAIGLFIRAMGGSINWTYSNVIIQKSAPDSYLGRMFSIDMVGFQLTTSLSYFVHGWLVDAVGSQHIAAIAWGTGVVALIPLLVWVWAVNRLEQIEEADDNAAVVAPSAGD